MKPTAPQIPRILKGKPVRLCAIGLLGVFLLGITSWAGLDLLDRTFPPPLEQKADLSVEVLDRNGKHLRVFSNSQGRYRLEADLEKIDQRFQQMLIAYEDKRFYQHTGVDPLALMRAMGQLLTNGRIVSGGSTLTMQLARLLEPRQQRSIGAKLRQILRALQIERRLSKKQILERYLTLAPYGGNIEGIRAASLSWFGKEPRKLELKEAALLVALPQSPENRRPDRFPVKAKLARDLVLDRMAVTGLIGPPEVQRVLSFPAPRRRVAMPLLAPHVTQAARERDPAALVHPTRLDSQIQHAMEGLAREAARKVGRRTSAALVVADSLSGDILASAGSAGIEDSGRGGWIDMTRAQRSPGSTLKPFIYGLAIEDGMVLPASLISDRPTDFRGYRPTNFDLTYQGDVPVRQALQMSLNVPAVKLLDAVSPVRLVSRFKGAGIALRLPNGEAPGLGLALGGAGINLTELVQLYVNLISTQSVPVAIGDGVRRQPGRFAGRRMLNPVSSWHVIDMLSGIREPVGAKPLAIAYKTGTSYGFRDAWSVGFDGRYVIGVWVGRADNGPVPGITGIKTAAPILFQAFEKSGLKIQPIPNAPEGALRQAASELPVPLRQFAGGGSGFTVKVGAQFEALQIVMPSDGAELERPQFADGEAAPIVVKLHGGVPPYRLMENQKPIDQFFRTRELTWEPEGLGTTTLSVVDAIGQAQSISLRIR